VLEWRLSVLSAAVGLAIASVGCDSHGAADLEHALVGRGRIAVLGGEDLVRSRAHGSELAPVTRWPELDRALARGDQQLLAQAMQAAGVQGILVDARPDAFAARYKLGAQLARYASSDVLQGAYLSPRAAFYVLDPVRDWSPRLRAGMAEVARRLVGGAPSPRLRSFPEATRRMEPAEVMVLLRSGGKPRLWRSARGSSFARALLTAAEVARQRWMEREQAMGGQLDKLLPRLQVEVSLLQDDGELGARDATFVNRVVFPQHGVAYERKGTWRYLLPEATHTSSPSQAYARLFAEDGLPEDSLSSRELRAYRMAVKLIGISAAQAEDGLSEVHSPEDVLGATHH
jgi:hypothetical protein